MVLIEAQAAGLPCVISNVIAPETTVVAPLVRRVSLERPPAEWVDEILALPTATAAISRRDARHRLEESRLNIHNSVSQLQTVYDALARQADRGNKQRNLAGKVRAVP
jgi:glycosyltransferase involved in cell wall biosynthesis